MSYSWKPYVSVAERRAKAKKEMEKLHKKTKDVQPVQVDGRQIAKSFWGAGWCDHLETFSDYDNRLPRGRTYVRNGSVCHLAVKAGLIEAIVSGSELYKVNIKIKALSEDKWQEIKKKCHGQIGTIVELLQGRLSNQIMGVVCDPKLGLFPLEGEFELRCSCPDWAKVCKHVAAVLYGVGSRLDHRPDLLFLLRCVNAEELISENIVLPATTSRANKDALADSGLADIFGIEFDSSSAPSKKHLPQATAVNAMNGKKAKKRGIPTDTLKTNATRSNSPVAKTQKKGRKSQTKPAFAKARPRLFDPDVPTGKDIAQLRKKSKLSILGFAASLGVSTASVERWEENPGPLRLQARPLAALVKLSEALTDS